MENASKALIIAGAILLSILIIGLGMFIYQKAAGAIGDTGIDTAQVNAYNSQFMQYDGVVSGAQARALCDVIRTHNVTHQEDVSLNVAITVGDTHTLATTAPTTAVTAATVNEAKRNIKSGKQYKVRFGYDSKTGYIVDCWIAENTTTTTTTP